MPRNARLRGLHINATRASYRSKQNLIGGLPYQARLALLHDHTTQLLDFLILASTKLLPSWKGGPEYLSARRYGPLRPFTLQALLGLLS